MGPKIDSLLYAILSSLLRNRFVLPCGSDKQILLKRTLRRRVLYGRAYSGSPTL
jgi:hypothetical protein